MKNIYVKEEIRGSFQKSLHTTEKNVFHLRTRYNILLGSTVLPKYEKKKCAKTFGITHVLAQLLTYFEENFRAVVQERFQKVGANYGKF